MERTGPFATTLSQTLTVSAPQAVNQVSVVRLANYSPWACTVDTESGRREWLQAWSAQLYDLTDVNPTLIVTPTVATGAGLANGQLLAEWYQSAEPQPFDLPYDLAQPSGATNVNTYTAGAVAVATSSLVDLLGTPPPGFLWEVALMEVHAPTTAAGTTAIWIAGRTSGVVFVLAYSGAAGCFNHSDAHFLLGEGLTCHNNTAVTGVGDILSRQVPFVT